MLEDRFHPLLGKIAEAPDSVALVTPDTVWTFKHLGAALTRFRHALDDLPDGPVLFHGHKEPDIVAAMLAAIWSGRGYVFADASNPPARLETICRTAEAVGAVSFARAAPALTVPVLRARDLPDADSADLPAPPAPVAGERLLYVTMTSGSTGTPKGVRVTRDNFDAFLAWFGPLCDTCRGHGAGHVNHANLAFDMSASDLWPALFGGRAVYLLDHRNNINSRATLRHLRRSSGEAGPGPGSWTSTPAFLSMMLADPAFCARELPALKTFFVGGEQVNRAMLRTLQERFPDADLLHGYGPSEATCITHCHALTARDLTRPGPLPLGRACGATQLRVVDPTGAAVGDGEIGEIELAGPQVSPGYLPADHPGNRTAFGASGSTAHTWRYRTGDYGWLGEDGCLFVEGRRDGQIKWNGNRIELGEIERAAMDHAAVENAVVLVDRGDDQQVRSVALVVQASRQQETLTAALSAHLKSRLPASHCPRTIHVLDHLPMTIAGKVDRQKIVQVLKEETCV